MQFSTNTSQTPHVAALLPYTPSQWRACLWLCSSPVLGPSLCSAARGTWRSAALWQSQTAGGSLCPPARIYRLSSGAGEIRTSTSAKSWFKTPNVIQEAEKISLSWYQSCSATASKTMPPNHFAFHFMWVISKPLLQFHSPPSACPPSSPPAPLSSCTVPVKQFNRKQQLMSRKQHVSGTQSSISTTLPLLH